MAKSASMTALLALLLTGATLMGQDYVVEWNPPFPTDEDSVLVTFYADRGTGGLAGYSGTVYAHSGVIINLSGGDSGWRYVIGEWGDNNNQPALDNVSADGLHAPDRQSEGLLRCPGRRDHQETGLRLSQRRRRPGR